MNKTKKNIIVFILFILLVSVVGYSAYVAYQYFQNSSVTDSSSAVIQSVNKLVALPKGDDPTVATVTDLESLKTQVFFKDARVGDKLLLFSKSKKALLYRPSENRIIVVGPINN